MKLKISLIIGILASLLAVNNLHAGYPAPVISANDYGLIHINYSGTPVDLWEYEVSFDSGANWFSSDEENGDSDDIDYIPYIGSEIRIYGADNNESPLTPYSNIITNLFGTDIIPVMTNYTTADVTMSASSETPTSFVWGHAWQVADDDSTSSGVSYWESFATNPPSWLSAQFSTQQPVYAYSITCGQDDFYNIANGNMMASPKTFILQGSNSKVEGSNQYDHWETLDTQVNVTWPESQATNSYYCGYTGFLTQTFKLSTPANYFAYRIYIEAVYPGEDENQIPYPAFDAVIINWELFGGY